MATIDHVILKVSDLSRSIDFYTRVMGFELAGHDGPFAVIRVGPSFVIQLAPWGATSQDHLAFALDGDEFGRAFSRIKEAGVPYGDTFDRVGTNTGPGKETGARGPGPTVYLYDPDKHLLEIRTYEDKPTHA
jgi:catechol 2,3-dioxygenase-like lactoylglutathione lyase family enzyme